MTQKVTILGTRGRIEIPLPFNAPADQATVIVIDDSRDDAIANMKAIDALIRSATSGCWEAP